jgi:predicted phosphodiesterase
MLTVYTYKSAAQQDHDFPAKINGKFPVTNLPFNNDSTKVQFAIISDLWGDNRPGVFEDAVSKIELLQPQFIMSVGDLTKGATYDTLLINKEWTGFNKMLRPLSMPFFYVPGNHDIGNPVMEKEWQRRFGKSYYYFVYKNTLFLCINTEDGGQSAISNEQINYFKKAIKDHPDVRWTFIFMHRPVWFTDSDKEEGFEKIESAFTGHNYTLFSGHFHTYLSENKNGYKHFILGTTGGGSELRGEKFGEYDHITWVTLNKKEEPKIINLKLNGLIKEDVVTERTEPITSMLIDQTWLNTPSYVSEKQFEKSINPTILFDNPTSYPLKIYGILSNDNKGYHISPEKISLTLQPQERGSQQLTVTSSTNSKLDLSKLHSITINLTAASQYDTVQYKLSAEKQMLLSWKYVLPELNNAEELAEANFKKGDTTGFISIRDPEYLEDHWYWSGPKDCLIRFNLTHNKKYIYLLAFIEDDQVVVEKANKGDLLYMDLEDKAGNFEHFIINPYLNKSFISDGKQNIEVKDLQSKVIKENNLIKIKLRIPVDDVVKPDHSFRFNLGYRDEDNHPESHSSSIFWKPKWGTVTDYKNSGTYILEGMK